MTVEYRRLEGNDDHNAQAAALVHDQFSSFFGSEYWDWKYRSPFLTTYDQHVYTAVVEDRVVGVYGVTGGEYLISPGNTVPCRISGDLVVHPEYRGKGISSGLIDFASSSIRQSEWSPVVNLGWTRDEILRHMGSNLGSVRVPSGTIAYTKTLNWDARLQELDATRVQTTGIDLGRQLSVSFQIDNGPRFVLSKRDDDMTWSTRGDSSVHIRGTWHSVDSAFVALSRRKLVEDLFSRRLHISGRPLAIRSLIIHRTDFGNALRPLTRP